MVCRTTFTIVALTSTTKDGPTDPVNVYDHLTPPPVRTHERRQPRPARPRRAARGSERQSFSSTLVLTARFVLSLRQDGWDRLAVASLRLCLVKQRFDPRWARLLAGVYRPALILRAIAAVAPAAGPAPRLGAVRWW